MKKTIFGKRELIKIIVFIFLFIVLAFPLIDYTPPDIYIASMYAKNLVNHGELSFNLGEPSYGFTSSLWVFLLAFFSYFSMIDPSVISKVLCIFFALLSIPLVHLLAKKYIHNKKFVVFIFFLWIINPWLIKLSFSGHDVMLFLFFVLLVFLKFDEMPKLCGVLIGLSILARPEGFVFLLTFFLASLFYRKKEMLYMILISILIITPWIIFSQIIFSTFIPAPLYIKGGEFSLSSALHKLGFIALEIFLFLPFFFKGMLEFFKQNNYPPLIFIILFSFFNLVIASESTRYFLPIIPLFLILSFRGLEKVRLSQRIFSILLSLFIIKLIAFDIFVYSFYPVQAIGFKNINYQIAIWLRDNTPLNATIATNDGIVGYFSERKLVDYTGILSPDALAFKGSPDEYIKLKKPDYLFVIEEYNSDLVEKLKPYLTQIISKTYEKWSILNPKVTATLYKFSW